MSITERLQQAMCNAGIDAPKDLARISGVSLQTVTRLLLRPGRNGPEYQTVKRLARACNVSHKWLAKGVVQDQATAVIEADQELVDAQATLRRSNVLSLIDKFGGMALFGAMIGMTEVQVFQIASDRAVRRITGPLARTIEASLCLPLGFLDTTIQTRPVLGNLSHPPSRIEYANMRRRMAEAAGILELLLQVDEPRCHELAAKALSLLVTANSQPNLAIDNCDGRDGLQKR